MREDFKRTVLERAKIKAKSLGYNLTTGAETDLYTFIKNGIDKMSSTELDTLARRNEAINNIEYLIIQMQNDAKSRFINESLDYTSYLNAKSSICPLWPFC